NEDTFEKSNIDTVRVAGAALDRDGYAHSILLLGFLFQDTDRADRLLALYDECFDLIAKNSMNGAKSGCAASMNGYLSSDGSDYTDVLLHAGLKFGLEGYDFGSSTSVKTADHLDVWDTTKYDWDYIVHIRTALGYGTVSESTLKAYADSFSLWKNKDGVGQFALTGAAPAPLRVLYLEAGLNDNLSKETVDALHQRFIDDFFEANHNLKASELTMLVDCSTLYA
ncbi:MAG: hypothetical protein IJ856_00210, partial [Candidatus Methanomethylophilaceae archaeon]|nr:hypothetical protein [Candidatus Methanomethylophilaceae archaeon]